MRTYRPQTSAFHIAPALPTRRLAASAVLGPAIAGLGVASFTSASWSETGLATVLGLLLNLTLVFWVGLSPIRKGLAREQGKLSALLNSVPEGVLEVDADGIILFANEQVAELFGYLPGELEGQCVDVLVPTDGRAGHAHKREKFLRRARSRPMGSTLEITGQRKDGSRMALDISLSCIGAAPSLITYCLVRDLSSHKAHQHKLLQTNKELVASVASLKRNAWELRELSEMGELLHSSVTEEELFDIVANVVQRLFPCLSGAIYELEDEQRGTATAMRTWGSERGLLRPVINRDDCWALRRSRPHAVIALDDEPRCRHHRHESRRPSRCVPLMGHGEVIGVLHLFCEDETCSEALADGVQVEIINAFANQVALCTANLRLRRTLRNQSLIDPLTGLYNRRAIDEWFHREIRSAIHNKQSLSLMLVDVDNFKHFNDQCGHESGDMALRQLAGLLRSGLRAQDLTCRLGGEEFAVLLPDTSTDEAFAIAEKLRVSAEQTMPIFPTPPVGPVTISIGIATLGRDGDSAEKLLRHADKALYVAKSAGRNRVKLSCDREGPDACRPNEPEVRERLRAEQSASYSNGIRGTQPRKHHYGD